MQLVVKLYSDKPSRLAVKFIYEYQAVRAYEDLLKKYPGESFKVTMELIHQKITLTLTGEQSGGRVIYKDLEFKLDQIQKLLGTYEKAAPFIFVHVFPKANTLIVAKGFRRLEFIQIKEIEFLGSLALSY